MSRIRTWWHDRKGASAVLFAVISAAVMLGVAAAIDFGGAASAKTKLDLAADTAAMTAATTASQMYVTGGSTMAQIQAAATTAGQQRFSAAVGAISNVATLPVPSISITQDTSTNAFTAVVSDSGTYTPYFSKVLGVGAVALTASSTVSVGLTAPYLNVEILLDNSGSMEIGAGPSDIATMQELTGCSLTGTSYCALATTSRGVTSCASWVQSSSLLLTDLYHTTTSSNQSYSAYACSGAYSYNLASPACPLPATTINGTSFPAFPVNSAPSCSSVVPMPPGGSSANIKHNGFLPQAGAPCAFACHFDGTTAAGTGNDYYALARSTIGTSYQVSLRFDLVKTAVRQVINTMQTDNLPINNLKVGIFWFADILGRVYPSSGEAGGDWQAALTAVGGPASVPNGPDTGIMPYVGANGGDTDFPTIMTLLSNTLTASGTGVTAASPRKVLFIVTDGLQDPASRAISAFNPASCTTFKNMGYKVYVLYTPYYSLMNGFYLGSPPSTAQVVQASPTSTISIPYNLQQCASAASGYIAASDSASISAALQTFLKQALTMDAHIVK